MLSDKQQFSDLMDDMGLMYDKDVTTRLKKLYWQDLSEYPMQVIEAALSAHRKDSQRGRFFPKPADVIAQIERATPGDGRIDADEAWAICLESMNEAATVCVTDEIMTGRAIASPIYEEGDRVGARMAFRAAYERAVGQARREYRPAKWFMSLGHDADGREHAIRAAVAAHRLTTGEAKHLLPPPQAEGVVAEIAGLIAGKKVAKHPSADDAVARQRIAELRGAIGMSDRKAGRMATQDEEAQARADAETFLRARGVA